MKIARKKIESRLDHFRATYIWSGFLRRVFISGKAEKNVKRKFFLKEISGISPNRAIISLKCVHYLSIPSSVLANSYTEKKMRINDVDEQKKPQNLRIGEQSLEVLWLHRILFQRENYMTQMRMTFEWILTK